jgi:ATP-binding cassette subfamily F protein 2
VIEAVEKEVARLEKESERLLEEEGPEADGLQDIYDKLDALEPSTFEKRAGELLYGLGFDKVGMEKKTKDMSGGWRMRVALAQALFVRPTILLLDEPTNHLDLNSCVWLEDHLRTYEKILVITSHSQDFLNGVCSNIMVIKENKLAYWAGNYDQYVKTRTEQETNQVRNPHSQSLNPET